MNTTTFLKFSQIEFGSHVDGPGCRNVLFVRGCSRQCPGCQSPHLWPPDDKDHNTVRPQLAAKWLTQGGAPITISGGEPFEQPEALQSLLEHIRKMDLHVHVIVYTGYTLDTLMRTGNPFILHALANIDVLVDGPYIEAEDSPDMQYRGSSNQRVIDLRATYRQPVGLIYSGHPILLDWDQPEIIITASGDLLATLPITNQFADIGTVTETRRCGETPA